jgi:hypothetical protein
VLKLLICILSSAVIAVCVLQLRQQNLQFGHQCNELHRKIRGRQSKLWSQQLQIAIYTAPNAITQTVANHDLKLVPQSPPRRPAYWVNPAMDEWRSSRRALPVARGDAPPSGRPPNRRASCGSRAASRRPARPEVPPPGTPRPVTFTSESARRRSARSDVAPPTESTGGPAAERLESRTVLLVSAGRAACGQPR